MKIFKTLYFKLLYIIINLTIMFGFLAPYLISGKHTEMVIFGVILIIADVSHLLFFTINIIKNLVKLK